MMKIETDSEEESAGLIRSGSKSVDAEVSRASMEMKLLIEQMHEQIQNLE